MSYVFICVTLVVIAFLVPAKFAIPIWLSLGGVLIWRFWQDTTSKTSRAIMILSTVLIIYLMGADSLKLIDSLQLKH